MFKETRENHLKHITYEEVIKDFIRCLSVNPYFEPCHAYVAFKIEYIKNLSTVRSQLKNTSYESYQALFDEVLNTYRQIRNKIHVDGNYLYHKYGHSYFSSGVLLGILHPGTRFNPNIFNAVEEEYLNMDRISAFIQKVRVEPKGKKLIDAMAVRMKDQLVYLKAINKTLASELTRETLDNVMAKAVPLHFPEKAKVLRKDAPAWVRGE